MKVQSHLIRHGQTLLNAGRQRIRAFLDVPLDPTGEQQALQAALKVKDFPVSTVYCSPLLRARQTARPVAHLCEAPMALEKKCLPWNCGPKIEGQFTDEVLPLIIHYSNNPNEIPPGGEPFRAFTERFLQFLNSTLDKPQRNKDVVLVTHSRCVHLARAWQAAGRPKDYSYDKKRMGDYSNELPPGSVFSMDAVK